jgi:forkhead box protein J2/3
MADLEGSLTAMDWLQRFGGALSGNPTGKPDGVGPGGKHASNHGTMRKSPNFPHDTNATLDPNDAQPAKDGKPPYSYANLIQFAINSSLKKKMTLSEIYHWICDNFPYYKKAGTGWKVRK